MDSKTCSKCGREKPVDEFSWRTVAGKRALQSRCKPCRAEDARAKYAASEGSIREYRAEVTRQYWDRIWSQVRPLKEVPCADCGQSYPHYVMDFDHRPDEVKSFGIASARRMSKTLEEILAEVQKCDVVCANCHRERTFQRRVGA